MIYKQYIMTYGNLKKITTIDLENIEISNMSYVKFNINLLDNQVEDMLIDDNEIILNGIYDFEKTTQISLLDEEYMVDFYIPSLDEISYISSDCIERVDEDELKENFEEYFKIKYGEYGELFFNMQVYSSEEIKKLKINNLLSVSSRKNLFEYAESKVGFSIEEYFNEFTNDIKTHFSIYQILDSFSKYYEEKIKSDELFYQNTKCKKEDVKKNLYTILDDIMSNSSETSEIFQISDEENRSNFLNNPEELKKYFDIYFLKDIKILKQDDNLKCTASEKRSSLLARIQKKKQLLAE
jgi:hypothetical protein